MKCIPSLERMDDGERGRIARILEVNRGENSRLISLSVILAVLGCSTLALAFVVASSSKARSSPFNWQLLYLIIPDFVSVSLCSIICAILASDASSQWACNLQSFLLSWVVASKSWLHALIGSCMYYMLTSSSRCLRYEAPTRTRISLQAVTVYVLSASLTLGWVFCRPLMSLPRSQVRYRMVCLPAAKSPKEQLIWWLIYLPVVVIVPFAYVAWTWYDVYAKQLLPRKGQRRLLYLFFHRLALVDASISLMSLIVLQCVKEKLQGRSSWIAWVALLVFFVRIPVTQIMVIRKPDIAQAARDVRRSVPCSTQREQKRNDGRSLNQSNIFGSMGSLPSILSWRGQASTSQSNLRPQRTKRTMAGSVKSSLFTAASSTMALDVVGGMPSPEDTDWRSCVSSIRTLEAKTSSCSNNHNVTTTTAAAMASNPSNHIADDGVDVASMNSYEDVPKQSEIHYQFDDELDERDPNCAIAFHIQEENDETELPVCPFESP